MDEGEIRLRQLGVRPEAGIIGGIGGSSAGIVYSERFAFLKDASIEISGSLTEQGVKNFMAIYNPETDMERYTAEAFLVNMGIIPTPDAVDQLVEVFMPCLTIMCQRPWAPDGSTWRESGRLGVLSDARKKFTRFWYRLWTCGKIEEDDSGYDLINYVAFVLRSKDSRWGEWGEPGMPDV